MSRLGMTKSVWALSLWVEQGFSPAFKLQENIWALAPVVQAVNSTSAAKAIREKTVFCARLKSCSTQNQQHSFLPAEALRYE